MPANFFKRAALFSMTGFEAKAPIFPNPKTAVPLEIIPTKFPFLFPILKSQNAHKQWKENKK